MKRLHIDISEQIQRKSTINSVDVYGNIGDTSYRISAVIDDKILTIRNDDGYDLTITYKKREDKSE